MSLAPTGETPSSPLLSALFYHKEPVGTYGNFLDNALPAGQKPPKFPFYRATEVYYNGGKIAS